MRFDLTKLPGKGRTATIAAATLILTGGAFTATPGMPQQQQPGQVLSGQGPPRQSFPPDAGPTDDQRNPMVAQMRRRQELLRNAERQKQMVNDTDKLLALAAELKTDVAKNGQEKPEEVSKKADRIEKLAKSVRDKMSAL